MGVEHVQTEIGGIEFCQRINRMVEQRDSAKQDQPCRDAAAQSLQRAGIEKWASDEGVGCADQLADLDFFSLRQDLQPYRVADDGEQGQPQQPSAEGL